MIYMVIAKYKSHPSITATKWIVEVHEKFEFSNADLFNAMGSFKQLLPSIQTERS